MFDRQFFAQILPEHVRSLVRSHAGQTAVLELHLAGGTTLDLCHVVRVADTWVAVAHFCRGDREDNTDIAFIPYQTIARVTISMRDQAERRIGFDTELRPVTPSVD